MLAAARQQQLLRVPCSCRKLITENGASTLASEPEKSSWVDLLRTQEVDNSLGRKHLSGATKSGGLVDKKISEGWA